MIAQKGDIGIVLGGNQKFSDNNEAFLGDHTVMIENDGPLTKQTPVIHMNPGGLYRWTAGDYWTDLKFVLRCKNTPLAQRACQYAASWIRVLPSMDDGGRNSYDTIRAKAVLHDIKQRGDLPYEFDAFRRSLKWNRRYEQPFSANKGLTCAAWVVACYQAAAFNDPSIESQAKAQTWEFLESKRPSKQERAELKKATPGHPSYREVANIGAKEQDALSTAIALLKKDKQESDKDFLARLLTKALMVDGRFLHTDGLVRRTRGDDHGWKVFKQVGQDWE